MKKTLQDQYLLIKEGKGHKGVFLADAKRDFPHIVPNHATFEEAAASLKTKNIISENVIGLSAVAGYEPRKKETYETAFEAFLAEARKVKENEDEKVKAEEKKVSKPVEKDLEKNFDYSDDKNPDNLIFDQIMMGYYAEMKDPKNADKTMQQLKDIVLKNLAKDPIHYTKDGQFGVKDLGYVTEHPGLGTPKEPKGKYASSGYGNLSENKAGAYEKTYDELKKQLTTGKENKFSPEDIKAKLKKKREEELERRKKAGESLEEITLRKAIQEMIDAELEEAYQMFNVNPSAGGSGEGGRRFIPNQLPFPQNIRKRFGDHIVYNPSSKTLYISQILYNNLVKGYGDQPAIKKLIMDIPPMVKQILNKPDNYGSLTKLPKEFQTYLPLNAEVEKAKADKFNKDGTKQYWSESDFLIPNLNVMEEGETESLMESVEKDLATINKEAEHEVLQSKLDKIDVLIDKRKSQLGKLDEDEDMKALTDKKKVKELQKDIKKLEQAKAKVEKIIGKTKTKKKEVIDETDAPDNLVSNIPPGYIQDAEERLRDGESIDSIIGNYPNLSFEDKNNLRSFLTWQQDSDIGQSEELDTEENY
jgi:hypothetical protein